MTLRWSGRVWLSYDSDISYKEKDLLERYDLSLDYYDNTEKGDVYICSNGDVGRVAKLLFSNGFDFILINACIIAKEES